MIAAKLEIAVPARNGWDREGAVCNDPGAAIFGSRLGRSRAARDDRLERMIIDGARTGYRILKQQVRVLDPDQPRPRCHIRKRGWCEGVKEAPG